MAKASTKNTATLDRFTRLTRSLFAHPKNSLQPDPTQKNRKTKETRKARQMSEEVTITRTDLPGTPTLNFVSSGKVRDLYSIRDSETGDEYLLFVATDRISAYDVVLKNVRYSVT